MGLLKALTASGVYKLTSGKMPHILALFIAIILAALVYGFLILIARIPEVMNLVNIIYHKVFRKKKAKKHIQASNKKGATLGEFNRRKDPRRSARQKNKQ